MAAGGSTEPAPGSSLPWNVAAQLARGESLALEKDIVGERGERTALQDLFGRAQQCWVMPRDAVGKSHAARQQAVVRHHFVDRPDTKRGARIDGLAGEAQLLGPSVADRVRQPGTHSAAGQCADPRMRVPEFRILRSNQEVAAERQLEV